MTQKQFSSLTLAHPTETTETSMIPPALARKLRNPPLEPQSFIATRFDSPEDKAWFGNHFLRFLATDCPFTLFSQRFYNRLSMAFGHIAHYNRHGFYDTFFESTQGRIEFLQQCLEWPCYGDPSSTYSDLERTLQARLSTSQILEILTSQLAIETRQAELALLNRLKAKYEPSHTPSTIAIEAAPPPKVQGDLFTTNSPTPQ